MITFNPLKKTLENRGISKYYLIEKGVLTYADLTRIETDHNYTLKFIDKMCRVLNCKVEDVIEFRED
jgi:putative transcriptional regulator